MRQNIVNGYHQATKKQTVNYDKKWRKNLEIINFLT